MRTLGIGVDALPEAVLLSGVLTGNDLGKLGNLEKLPSEKEVSDFLSSSEWNSAINTNEVHQKAQALIASESTEEALLWLLAKHNSE